MWPWTRGSPGKDCDVWGFEAWCEVYQDEAGCSGAEAGLKVTREVAAVMQDAPNFEPVRADAVEKEVPRRFHALAFDACAA